MKTRIATLILSIVVTSLCLAQTPGDPSTNGLVPLTDTFDVNTNFNNTSTESTGVGITANNNVLIAWEDDSSDAQMDYWGAVWRLYDGNGAVLTTPTLITNFGGSNSITSPYLAYFRDDGTPAPGHVAWGPKIHANPFGDGIGMGGSASAGISPWENGMAFEIPRLFSTHLDAGGTGLGDFPAVQLLSNDGSKAANVLSGAAEADAEAAGNIRIADWEYLANGNIVIVGESRQADDYTRFGFTPGGDFGAVYRIVTAAGVEVKGYAPVSSATVGSSMWHGVGATANGFAVRFNQSGSTKVRMFDNAGNPTTANIDLATLTGNPATGGGGRGDGTGFHGNGLDAYVYVNTSGGIVYVSVLNANGTLRYFRRVTDEGTSSNADRVDGAIAPDGRVIAVFDDSLNAGSPANLVQGRLFGPLGDALGGVFYVSERETPSTVLATSRRPRVAIRGNRVAVIWESLNSPVTTSRVVAARLFSLAIPVISAGVAGLSPRTPTFDVNTNFNNTSTESTGVGITANNNVLIAWEDDSSDAQMDYWGAVWRLYDGNGAVLTTPTLITNFGGSNSITSPYLACFRDDGTPTPGHVAWGPKIHANPFGDGIGMGGSASAGISPWENGMAFEISRLFSTHLDAAGTGLGDFPAVQLLNNDGSKAANVLSGAAEPDAEAAGNIRIADWEYLANGNTVIVGESRQADDYTRFGFTPGGDFGAVYRIVTAAGVEVKGYAPVSSATVGSSMWHGVGVTANGFAVRFNQSGSTKVRMFDNAGNPTTANIDLATLTGRPEAGGGGRGDGTGFHGNGKDAYVYVNDAGAAGPWVTVLNANGTLRWSRAVADSGETIDSDRVDGTITPDGRVIAVFDDNQAWTGGSPFRLTQARLFEANGRPFGGRFFVSDRDNPQTATAESRRPRVSWRGNRVAVIWESLNSPATTSRVVAARVFTVVYPTTLSIARSGNNVVLSWEGGGRLLSAPEVTGPWSEVSGAASPHSMAFTGDRQFFRVVRQ